MQQRDEYPPGADLQVLLLENDPGDASCVAEMLKCTGVGRYELRPCARLPDLLSCASTRGSDLILLDLSSRTHAGLATLQQLRAVAPEASIVVLTARDDQAAAQAALRAGAQDHCTKEASEAATLARILRHALERKDFARLALKIGRTERLNAVGQLAAGIAHEINNPATYLLANIDRMRELTDRLRHGLATARECAEDFREQDRSRLEQVFDDHLVDSALEEMLYMLEDNLAGVTRVCSITRELKNFSHLDRKQIEWLDLNDAVRSACRMASNDIHHRARLVLELRELPRIAADPERLVQAVLNLLRNAAQAIQTGAAGANRIRVETRAEEARVVLEIEDTGCGMSAETRRRIFEPFFTTREREVGTGLGLALTEETVLMHGGELRVESEPDAGTCVRLSLPLDTGLTPAAEAPPELARAPDSRPARVLLVDDDARIRFVLRRMLQEAHEVVEAEGGVEALETLAEDRAFDVILCDLMMPNGDGMMLFEQLRETAPELLPRLVFITGGAFTQRAREFLARSSVPVLEKPISHSELLAAIDRTSAVGSR